MGEKRGWGVGEVAKVGEVGRWGWGGGKEGVGRGWGEGVGRGWGRARGGGRGAVRGRGWEEGEGGGRSGRGNPKLFCINWTS